MIANLTVSERFNRLLGLLTASGGLAAGAFAFFAASCCVLPLIFVIMGVGGAWLSVFDVFLGYRIEAVEISAIIILAGWIILLALFWRRRTLASSAGRPTPRLRQTSGFRILVFGSLLVFGAWLINTYQGDLTRSLFQLRSWLNE